MSKEAIQKGIDALRGVITWDIMRNHLVPYRVRDPIHEAIEALAALAEQPAQRKPLTDEEIEDIFNNWPTYHLDHYEFARAIEAAHGIKENT